MIHEIEKITGFTYNDLLEETSKFGQILTITLGFTYNDLLEESRDRKVCEASGNAVIRR